MEWRVGRHRSAALQKVTRYPSATSRPGKGTTCLRVETWSTSKAASSTLTGRATTRNASQRYYSWAELMRRVIAIDVLECPRCQVAIKILVQIQPPDTTRKTLQLPILFGSI